MGSTQQLPDLSLERIELLETVGYNDVRSLARADVGSLEAEIQRANKVLKFSQGVPSIEEIEGWIMTARKQVGDMKEEIKTTSAMPCAPPVPVALAPQGVMRVAIPLPASIILDHGLQMAEIPAADEFVTRELERPAPPVTSHLPKVEASRSILIAGGGEAEPKLGIDRERIKPLNEAPVVSRNPSIDRPLTKDEERIALIRTPRERTNRGKSPNSRRYIRGVLHTHPVRIWLGAISTLLVMVSLPLAVVSAALLMLSREMEDVFGWVPKWFLAFPALLLVAAVFYLVFGMQGSCRICGQKLFMHRHHRKNIKAHTLPGLGYVIPLCLHILLFRWFRCTHCGTPVRLKE